MAVSCITLRFATAFIGFFRLRIGGRHRQNRRHVAHAGGFIAGQTIRDEKGNNTPHQAAIICCVLNIGLYESRRCWHMNLPY